MGLGPQREALEALGFDIVVAEESELIATARRWHPDCVMTKLVYVVFVREVPRLSAAMIEQDRAGLERRARGLDSSALPNGFQKGVAVLSAYVADAVDEDARRLADLTRDGVCKINLIPYNVLAPVAEGGSPGSRFRRPSDERINQFREIVALRSPHTVTLRLSRGRDIDAACGQLYREVH